MFVHKFVDTIFERHVTFIVSTAAEYEQYLRERGIKDKVTKGACGETSSYPLPSEWYVGLATKHFFLWMTQFRDDVRDLGTLAHECFHIAQSVMEEVGVPYYIDDDNEPFAYYTDALVRQFLSAWRGRPVAGEG